MKLEENIKSTVIDLVGDLKDNIFTKPEESGDLLLVEFFFTKLDAKDVADHIVEHVLPYAAQIQKEDTKFFISQKDHLFKELQQERVDYFSDLLQKTEKEGGLDNDSRKAVWEYFKVLVQLAEAYKKKI